MLEEEAAVPGKLLSQISNIERALKAIVRGFKSGGRLFYVGAGTSGRLGVMEAAECPPTFSLAPECVQGIVAGGHAALWKSMEGAEDDGAQGVAEIRSRKVASRDVVIGITASGTTPFVWGAFSEARRRKAVTVLLCFNPYLRIPRNMRPTVVIAPDLGPEVLTGSTRLKAGTATKLVLNLFSTLSMARLGKVRGNLMIAVAPTNAKLRVRAARIVAELTGVSQEAARTALARNGWNIGKAIRLVESYVNQHPKRKFSSEAYTDQFVLPAPPRFKAELQKRIRRGDEKHH